MGQYINYIPATPRSKVFKYYQSTTGGGIGGSTVINNSVGGSDTGDGYNYLNVIGSGNMVSNIVENSNDSSVLDITMGTALSSLSLSNATDTTTNLNFLTNASSASGSAISNRYKTLVAGSNITLSQSGSNVTINANTGGYSTILNSADTTANLDLLTTTSYGGGNLITNKYKTLVAGSGISISAPNGSSQITITNTAQGSSVGSTIQDVTPSAPNPLIMYRYEYFFPSNINIAGYGNYIMAVAKSNFSNINSFYNYFPSIIYKSSSNIPNVSLAIVDTTTAFGIVVINNNPASATIPSGTEIDILIFGV